MRKKIAFAGLGLAAAATFAPLTAASASCTDLSAVGGPSCASLCPGAVVTLVNKLTQPGFLACTM